MANKKVSGRLKQFMWPVVACIACLVSIGAIEAAGGQKTRFWNLTGETIVKFELAATGTDKFGPDQCKNDKDGAVDDDERLFVQDVASGAYDARITFKTGRVCLATNIAVTEGKIFSIDTKQLTGCSRPK
ncbi:MAG: hypothetical protein ACLP8A_05540 [Methylovirgula sp.]